MKVRITLVVLALAASTAGALAQSTTRWVDRAQTDVRAGPGSFYEVVDTVIKGDTVEVVKTEGRWLFVTTPRTKQGWVFEAAVSATTVTPGGSDFLKLTPGDASASASAVLSLAMGIFPWSPARQAEGYDDSVVTWLEQNQPTATEFARFVTEGGLAPAEDRK